MDIKSSGFRGGETKPQKSRRRFRNSNGSNFSRLFFGGGGELGRSNKKFHCRNYFFWDSVSLLLPPCKEGLELSFSFFPPSLPLISQTCRLLSYFLRECQGKGKLGRQALFKRWFSKKGFLELSFFGGGKKEIPLVP